MEEVKMPDYLNKLMEGCSTYAKVATQFWVTTALISIITISPIKLENGKNQMPFNLGVVADNDFYPFTFTAISLLIICFGSAICQSIRTRVLIQRAINQLKATHIFDGYIYLQDIVDAVLYPALNRVGPLAQVLHGKKQFFPEAKTASLLSRIFSGIYYVSLKLVATFALYGLPFYALITSFKRIYNSPTKLWQIPRFVFWIIGVFAIIILVQLFVLDILYTIGAWKRINPKLTKTATTNVK